MISFIRCLALFQEFYGYFVSSVVDSMNASLPLLSLRYFSVAVESLLLAVRKSDGIAVTFSADFKRPPLPLFLVRKLYFFVSIKSISLIVVFISYMSSPLTPLTIDQYRKVTEHPKTFNYKIHITILLVCCTGNSLVDGVT